MRFNKKIQPFPDGGEYSDPLAAGPAGCAPD